ncbi:MAG TPA: ABC transporter substrate-binding protein [Stellaceae bacterium]|nr:ABC transporter substrate-binding protein [Stellaceae bacterium]
MHRKPGKTLGALAALAALVCAFSGGHALAADKLRVGKAILNSFTFGLLDVGIKNGNFAKAGLDIEPVVFTGATRLQQAMTSNDIDLGLSTGQDLGYIVKGAPVMTVAAITNAPRESVMLVGQSSPIKTVTDLKGKKVAVSNIRGYPAWLALKLSEHEGWGPHGMDIVATGSQPASMAMLRTGQVDAWIGDLGSSIDLQEAHEGRILLNMGDYVPPFMNIALYATNILIKDHPELVRRFIKAWFDNIAWASAHREETVAILVPLLHSKPSTLDQVYAQLMPTQSTDGRFDPKAMATMRKAVVELGILPEEPDIAKLYTAAFLPKK